MSNRPTPEGAAHQRPTMRDVAQLAGVSLKTVSRVVNNELGVSTDMAARVNAAVAQLGFRPNLTASNLRRTGGRTSTIGLLLENLANPFSSTLYRAIEDACLPEGVAVFAGSVDEDPERERALVKAFAERRVDGMIIVPAGNDQAYLIDEIRNGTRIVFVDRPSSLTSVDRVLVDNRDASSRAVQHLLDHGHRSIAYLGDLTTVYTARERFEGYRDAHVSAAITPDERFIVNDLHNSRAAEQATLRLFDHPDPPTALFGSQNLVTVGMIRALRSLGRSGSIAVVGFDDFALADLVEPAVTVVAQDTVELGRVAAELLLQRLDGLESAATEVIVPTTLIARGSGEISPSR